MSRNFAVLSRENAQGSLHARTTAPVDTAAKEQAAVPGDYAGLIRTLFRSPAVVAVIGGQAVAEDLSAELGAAGKRVLLVPVNKLLQMNPISAPAENDFVPGKSPKVWCWPAPSAQRIEFFKSLETANQTHWLDSLRHNFPAVLLDCPNITEMSGITRVAALADAVVLVVEAGRTSALRIQRDQRALQIEGARIAGSILVRRR